TRSPTRSQLLSLLLYLDAVVHEAFQLNPPVGKTIRIMSLMMESHPSAPATTASRGRVSSLVLPKGTTVTLPMCCVNHSKAFWVRHKAVTPECLLGSGKARIVGAWGIRGHKHLFTFSDGPRIYLGCGFALTEFKV
ncbi:hypothetical protein BD779DRAFT_1428221, partial [Infundibulicybe gibba]